VLGELYDRRNNSYALYVSYPVRRNRSLATIAMIVIQTRQVSEANRQGDQGLGEKLSIPFGTSIRGDNLLMSAGFGNGTFDRCPDLRLSCSSEVSIFLPMSIRILLLESDGNPGSWASLWLRRWTRHTHSLDAQMEGTVACFMMVDVRTRRHVKASTVMESES
jgi:hypothetical protein